MKKIFIIMLLVLSLGISAMSLEKAKELGLKNNLSLQNSINSEKNAKIQKYQAYSNILPQISGNAGASSLNDLDSKNYGYQITQPIFQGGAIFYGMKQASNNQKKAENETKSTKIDVEAEIEKKYYSALLSKKQMEIARKSLKMAKTELEKAETRFKAGSISKTDFLNFQLNESEKRNSFLNYQNSYDIALENLANYLNISEIEVEEIRTAELEEEIQKYDNLSESKKSLELKKLLTTGQNNNLDLSNSEINLENSKANLRISQLSLLPNISLSAQQNWQKNEFQTDYEDTKQVSLNFSISLFPLVNKTGNILKNKYNLRNSKNNYENLEKTVDLQIKTTFYNLLNSAKSIKSSEISIQRAESLYKQSLIKYELGKISANDLLDSSISLENAKMQYAKNFYEFLEHKSNLKKLIPNL